MSIGYDKSTVGGFVFSNSDTIASNIRMVILSTGSVGIGTNAPDSKLEIAGGGYNSSLKIKGGASHTGIQFEDSDGNTDGYVYAISDTIGFLDAGADWTIQSKNDDYIRFSTNGNTEHMRIKSDGKVGIGTDAPSCLLQLSTTSVQGNALLSIRRNGDAINFGHSNGAGYGSVIGCSVNNGFPHLGFMCEAGTNNNTFRTRGLAGNVIYSNTSGALNFAQITTASADNQAPTDRVTILSGGNVGIGTVDPKAPVHIFSNGTLNTPQIVLCLGANTSNAPTLQFSENTNAGFNTGMSIQYRGDYGAGDANALAIHATGADATTAGAAVATFKNGGKVGIGTTDPGNILHVKKSTAGTAALFEAGGTNVFVGLKESGGNFTYIGNDAGKMLFQTSGSSYSTKLIIQTDGNVGIGTVTPGSLLSVSGNSDDGDGACTIAINDEDSTVGSKLPAIQFYGGGTTQGRIRGGDAAFQIAVGSSPTTALNINTANGYPSFTYGSQVRLTLGSTGTAETNTANWVRASGANLEFNAASGDFNWEVGGVHRMRLTDTGFLVDRFRCGY